MLSYICAAVLWVAAIPASAGPNDGFDPFGKLLVEKGLVPQPAGKAGNTQAEPAGQNRFAAIRDRASDMVLTAMNFLGVPYVRGGDSEETGFDCSGFTRFIFERSIGLILPRRADEQANAEGMIAIRRDELRPGDLVFFNTLRRTFSHVGIYIGDGRFIHAPKPGAEVRVEDMGVRYWSARFTGARRAVLNAN
ncbi:C40 family peptidase [Piscinibacter sakaiensis]|uniref:C40 family peptidase n=1 Tax=Piscinibacter sakaiensis TaxID=1547922 RepID=UPI003AAEE8FF